MRIDYDKKFFNGKSAFENVADLQNKICTAKETNIDVYLTNSFRYGKTFVFLLGCLIVLSVQFGKRLKLYLPNKRLMDHVREMGIWDYYRLKRKDLHTFFRLENPTDVIQLVARNLEDAPIQMTDKLNEALVSIIGEVYNNAVEHSEAKYVMGGCYKKLRKKLYFSCYDTGVGIISNVKNYFNINGLPSYDKFEINAKLLGWAFGKGHSTKPQPRGVGFDWLLDFAKINHGRVTICNNDVLFVQNPQGEKHFAELQNPFRGTFFELEIVETRDVIYKLKGE
ncbi:MAG: hypothetical protein IJ849_03790 [Selenomonadaceae bacterium]|nr:hypothetical protein [Selenomonadaceae bacterium]